MTGSAAPAARALIAPALELRRALDAGMLLTPWAEARCGQEIRADIARVRPEILDRAEAVSMGMTGRENWACLRRTGMLVQADGTEVARVTAVVALSRVSPAVTEALQKTHMPLGSVLPDGSRALVLWCSAGVTEYAVTCQRLILVRDRPVALTTDRVLWSWLGGLG